MTSVPGEPDPPPTRRELRRRAEAAGPTGAAADPAAQAGDGPEGSDPTVPVPQPWQPPRPAAPEPWSPLVPPPTGPRYHSAPVYPGMPGYTPVPDPVLPGGWMPGGPPPGPAQPGQWTGHPPVGSPVAPALPPPADDGPRSAMHWLLPVGRSWQSLVAGYLGLFSLLLWPLGVVAIGFGVWALVLARRGGHGTGRAVTGIVGGVVGVVALVAFLALG